MTAAIAEPEDREAILRRLSADRVTAHRVLFPHRHNDQSPQFHAEMIKAWYSKAAYVQFWAFRGAAKSTLGEEAIALTALFRECHNALIVGSSIARAVERLDSVKHEMETNDYLEELFGRIKGRIWADERIVLSNGVIIQAMGRGQKMRGTKFVNWRPDFVLLDDIDEDEESRDPEVQEKTANWLFSVLLPGCDPRHRIRFAATPRDPEGLPVRLKASPQWETMVYPIETVDWDGERIAQWPARFPLAWVDQKKAEYFRQGKVAAWKNEFLCEVDQRQDRSFLKTMMRVEPRVRAWEAVYCAFDPARTVNKKGSAQTGSAAWSWIGNRLVIWEAEGGWLKPDEIIARIFDYDERFQPIMIGVEQDGLNEFILQPLRHEQIRRGRSVPIQALKAPKGKIDFIGALQPFFHSGEASFAKPLPDLETQLLGFPQGLIDVPNALAYATRMRPGQPMFDDFGSINIAESLPVNPRAPVWLALNASGAYTTGVLSQIQEGRFLVLADWVMEGEPGAVLPTLLSDANREAGRAIRVVIGPEHMQPGGNIGLAAAARKLASDGGLHVGLQPHLGRDEIRALLRRSVRQLPALQIAHQARWTLNAFAGGYAREMMKTGQLADWAVQNQYRVLMEGLETFAALGRIATETEGGDDRRLAVARDGRTYTTALARRR